MGLMSDRYFEWWKATLWGSLYFDEEEPSEEVRYQQYESIYNRFISNRSLNESESFDRIELLNQEFKILSDRLKKFYSKKDSGTSGDIVEIEISKLLKKIFPEYKIITKGVIRDNKGNLSPQIDVLILDRDYPLEVLSGNSVSAESVLFAIECKLTLRKNELIKSIETAKFLKTINGGCKNHLLYNQIKYGVFALSNEVSARGKKTEEAVLDVIQKNTSLDKPLEVIDFVCVPNDYSIYLDIFIDEDPHLENPEHLYYIARLEAYKKNYPFSFPNIEPLGNFIYKTIKIMNKITNRNSIWLESNFGVFNTVSSSDSDYYYQMLSEAEYDSIIDKRADETNTKIELSLSKDFKNRHCL